jgi:hypothetical protein
MVNSRDGPPASGSATGTGGCGRGQGERWGGLELRDGLVMRLPRVKVWHV